jgi:hypothetical protein
VTVVAIGPGSRGPAAPPAAASRPRQPGHWMTVTVVAIGSRGPAAARPPAAAATAPAAHGGPGVTDGGTADFESLTESHRPGPGPDRRRTGPRTQSGSVTRTRTVTSVTRRRQFRVTGTVRVRLLGARPRLRLRPSGPGQRLPGRRAAAPESESLRLSRGWLAAGAGPAAVPVQTGGRGTH